MTYIVTHRQLLQRKVACLSTTVLSLARLMGQYCFARWRL